MTKKDEAGTKPDEQAKVVDQAQVDATQAKEAEQASKPQFTREQLEAMGLDPAPYGL
ncbi:hypothetical protein GGC47_003169 [Bosea sp. OAE752]|jgi:hypothetical protein|uniref:hypothetical protein n=1 Tax=Bosea sp. OAE752 TaxID=2663873 RepID=UPI003D1E5FD0